MAHGMSAYFGEGCRIEPTLLKPTDKALVMVREPFVSKTSAASVVCGWITPSHPLVLASTMSEGSTIFVESWQGKGA